MKYLINNSTDPYYNMSFDEYCLEQLDSDDMFFYLWRNRPSVIIGYNQDAIAEVNLKYLADNDILLVRRVTGGGAVYHDLQNLNYSILAPLGKYDPVSLIEEGLRNLGVPAERTGRNDIFVEGRKVSGYARRVYKNRELVHGTLMYNVDLETLTHALDVPGSKLNRKGVASVRSRVANLRDYLPQFADLDALQEALRKALAGNDGEMKLPEGAEAAIREMRDTKFAAPEWLFRLASGDDAVTTVL